MIYLLDSGRRGGESVVPEVDVPYTERVADLIKRAAPRDAREGRDATSRYIDRLLRCPETVLQRRSVARHDSTDSLDSICNFR